MNCCMKKIGCIKLQEYRLVKMNVLLLCMIIIIFVFSAGCSNQTKEIVQPSKKVSQTITNNKYSTKENVFGEKGLRLVVKLPPSIELKPYEIEKDEAIQSQSAFSGTGEGANYFVRITLFQKNAEPNLEQISNNFIMNVKALKGVTEFNSSKKVIKVSGKDAILIELKYNGAGQSLSDKAVYIIDGKKFWQVGVQYEVNKETQIMANEVIQSVKVLD